MKLRTPITILRPAFDSRTGRTIPAEEFVLNAIEFTLLDAPHARRCDAKISPFPFAMTLWEGDAYDSVGDYTQRQAEGRIWELLGEDPKQVLESLFVRRCQRTVCDSDVPGQKVGSAAVLHRAVAWFSRLLPINKSGE